MRAAIDLATQPGTGLVQLRDIAERQAIPEKYLEQLLRALKTGGVVLATRGSRGGYQLARSAQELSVLDVLQAIDGPLGGDDGAPSRGSSAFVVAALWEELTAGLSATLAKLSVADLAERYRCERASSEDWII